MIVAGTTIGAGMIALPISSSSLGFPITVVGLLVIWVLMLFTALLALEINLNNNSTSSIAVLAEKFLGNKAKWVTRISIVLLFYALIAAYTSATSSIIANSLDLNESLTSICILVFCAIIIFLYTKVVDYTNRILFSLKIFVFIIMILVLFPQVDPFKLIDMKPTYNQDMNFAKLLIPAIPVFFTSFGFHGSIPAVMEYVGKDRKSLYQVFIIGSLLPLLTYFLWEIITLGVLPQTGANSFEHVAAQNNSISVFINDLSIIINNQHLALVVKAFTLLAIITSFFGVAIGLFHFFREIFPSKITSILATFVIPGIIAIAYPKGFVMILSLAAIFLSIIAVLMPSLVHIKQNKLSAPIVISILFGVSIILIELFNIGF